jgi:hypothetical protein
MVKSLPLLGLSTLLLFAVPLLIYAQPSGEIDPQARRSRILAEPAVPTDPGGAGGEADIPAAAANQPSQGSASLAQLDGEARTLGNQILQSLSSLPEGARIRLGLFSFEGGESSLGVYWRNQLSSILSGAANRNFIILTDTGEDYSLQGDILLIGNTLRIYTRLIKPQDSSVITTWNTDLGLTPLTEALIASSQDSSSSSVRRDSYEPDSRDAPVPLEIGGSGISRTIHQGDEDWFRVQIDTSGILILETDSSIDTYLELYAGDSGSSSKLASNDDGGRSLNARLEYFVEAGKTYIAKVRGVGGDTGTYRLTAVFNAQPADSAEPNDTKETATSVTLDTPVTANFASASDVDWYKLEAPEEGGVLTVYTEGNMDTEITLYDEAGSILAEDDDSGSRWNARVSIQTAGGTLYIRVIEVDGDRGPYTLQTLLTKSGPQDDYEPDNSRETAKDIEIGSSQARTFTTAKDIDWVTFTVTEAGSYRIRTIGADRNLDTYIELFDENGEYLDEDDDGGDCFDSRLIVPLDPGTYCISIRTLNDDLLDNNAYTLEVSVSSEDS